MILLLAATTAWAQTGNVTSAALQDLNASRSAQALPGPSDDLLAKLESIYKDIHANPELSMQEQRTAGIAADWLRQHGYEVTEAIGSSASEQHCVLVVVDPLLALAGVSSSCHGHVDGGFRFASQKTRTSQRSLNRRQQVL